MKRTYYILIFMLLLGQSAAAQYVKNIAGNNICDTFIGEGGRANHATIGSPFSIALDHAGNIFFTAHGRLLKITAATDIITCIGGNGTDSTDNVPAVSTRPEFGAMCMNPAGDFYVTCNYKIRKIDHATGIVTTVAGGDYWGNSGDGGPATDALFMQPFDVALDTAGNLYMVDAGAGVVRKVDAATGVITTVAGNGSFGYNGDSIMATDASLFGPFGVYADKPGNLYIADAMNSRVRRVDATTHMIATIAGSGIPGSIMLTGPMRITMDTAGNLYFSMGSGSIMRLDAISKVVTRFAGIDSIPNSGNDTLGDGGPATNALMQPIGLCFDDCGDLFVADGACHLKVITPTPPVGDHICNLLNSNDEGIPSIASGEGMNIFPNPAHNGLFTISLPQSTQVPAQVIIRDIMGRTVLERTLTSREATIDLNQPLGVYLVQVITQAGRWQQKVVNGD
jgi:trimeric autotransporter adhesin